jgi:hypothetical protein
MLPNYVLTIRNAKRKQAQQLKPIFATSSNFFVRSTIIDAAIAPTSPTPNRRAPQRPENSCNNRSRKLRKKNY